MIPRQASYICLRQTTTVLSTIDTVDFLYTCDNHLTDRGFATRLESTPVAPSKAQVGPDEIERIKKEYEEKQAKKKKEQAKDGDAKEEKKEEPGASALGTTSSSSSGDPPATSPSTPAAASSHQKYALHRDIYRMRCDEYKRRRQTKQAKEVAPKLPFAPRTQLP